MTVVHRALVALVALVVALSMGNGPAFAVSVKEVHWQPSSQPLAGGVVPLGDTRYDGQVFVFLQADVGENCGALQDTSATVFLQATIGGDLLEVPIGSVTVPAVDIDCGDGGFGRSVALSWSSPEARGFAMGALHAAGTRPPFSMVAKVVGGNAGRVDHAAGLLPVPPSGDLRFADFSLAASDVTAAHISPDGGCGPGRYRLTGPVDLAWAGAAGQGYEWSAADTSVLGGDALCLAETSGPHGEAGMDLVVVFGGGATVPLSTVGTLGGLDAALQGTLGHEGLDPLYLGAVLPRGHTVAFTPHRYQELPDIEGDLPQPPGRGASFVTFLGRGQFASHVSIASIDELAGEVVRLDGYYHLGAEELPLTFGGDTLRLDSEGLRVTGLLFHARWVRDQQFSWFDRRRLDKEGPRTNDVQFKGVVTHEIAALVNGTGLQGSAVLQPSPGLTHYPAGTLTRVEANPIAIVDGRIVATPLTTGATSFAYRVDTSCPGCGGFGKRLDRNVVSVASGYDTLHPDGTEVMRVNAAHDPAWGPERVGEGRANTFVFARDGDANRPAMLVIPGFIAEGSALPGQSALESLLGSFRLSPAPGRSPAQSAGPRRGNGFFAGVTFGPETYRRVDNGRAEAGQGRDLAGTHTDIAIGGATRDYSRLTASAGTKLVERPGGVTGAFNFTGVPEISLYGYETTITGFDFRVADSRLDPMSGGFDGRVTLRGPADFSVAFLDLSLECTGQIGDGVVDPDPAKNPPQRLRAWNAPFAIRTVGYQPAPGDGECAENARDLHVGGGVRVEDLAGSLDLDTSWASSGAPKDSKLTGSGAVELARHNYVGYDGVERTYGFKQLVDGVTLRRRCDTTAGADDACGWFELGGLFGLPFWNAMPVVARATNVPDGNNPDGSPKFKAGKTVVAGAGFPSVSSSWAAGTLADVLSEVASNQLASVDATYDWALPLRLPVRWDHPRFVADPTRPATANLGIFEVHGAADYITPEDTRISFGASADLAKIRPPALALSIDLRDPESVSKVDGFLTTLIGTGAPLGPTPLGTIVGTLRSPSRFIQQAVGSGFDGFLEDGIRAAVESGPIKDATDAMAQALGVVQTLPQQLAKAVFDPLKDNIDQGVSAIGAPVESLAMEVWSALPAQWTTLVSSLAAFDAGTQTAAQIETNVANVRTWLIKLDQGLLPVLETVKDKLQAATSAVEGAKKAVAELAAKVEGYATTARDAVGTVLSFLDPSAPPPANGPDPGRYFKCTSDNPILSQVDALGTKVKLLGEALDFGKFSGLLNSVTGVVGIDAKPYLTAIDKAVNPMKTVTKALVGDDGKGGYLGDVKKVICQGSGAVGNRLQALVAKVRALLLPIKTGLDQLLVKTNGKTRLQTLVESVTGKLDAVVGSGTTPPLTSLAGMRHALTTVHQRIAKLRDDLVILTSWVEESARNNGRTFAQVHGDLAASGEHAIRSLLNGLGVDALTALGASPAVITTWQSNDGGWVDDATAPTKTFVSAAVDLVRKPLDELIGAVSSTIGQELSGLVSQIPFPTGAELREHLITFIMQSPVIEQLTKLMHEATHLLFTQVDALGNQVLDQLNAFLKEVVAKLNALAEQLLGSATAAVKELASMGAAKLDGFAEIRGDDLMRLQIDGEYSLNDDAKSKSEGSNVSFKARLKIESWESSDKAKNCDPDALAGVKTAPLDASLTVRDLPIVIGPGNLKISKLELGFTLEPSGDAVKPVGVFGGIDTTGTMDFQAFQLYDIGIAAGVGKYENYLGARAAARFQGYDMSAAFLVGRTCDGKVLNQLDPEFGKYVNTDNGFAGVYVRGSCSFPIYDLGCLFRVGAGVDVGIWILDGVYGGLLGGRINGKALCLVGVAGGIRLVGQFVDGDPQFLGEGWAAGGIGFCDSDEWQSINDAIEDGGCAVGWAAIGAEYKNGSFSLTRFDLGGLD